MFKPSAGLIMVEIIVKKTLTLHLPQGADAGNKNVDIKVAAVGKGVDGFAVGESVIAPLPIPDQMAKFDPQDGGGERQFIFYKEDEVFGKFTEEK